MVIGKLISKDSVPIFIVLYTTFVYVIYQWNFVIQFTLMGGQNGECQVVNRSAISVYKYGGFKGDIFRNPSQVERKFFSNILEK